jgi:hypothetical protein
MVTTAVGWRAHAALTASGGRFESLVSQSKSFYARAAGELIWIGPPGSPLHPRAVLATPGPSPRRLQVDGCVPWRPPERAEALRDRDALAHVLQGIRVALGKPKGLGGLFDSSEHDDEIVRRARPCARAVAAACARDDLAALVDAARPLLGLGDGLTPSGDDFVGGALFARRLLGGGDASALDAVVARIVKDAATRTHPISARLLADLGAGEGWAPLHDLAAALAAQDSPAAMTAARELIALGHSSGWSLHSGLMAGLAVTPNP